ncbi:uncharacterized protein LOC124364144 [Homalodisca vitripennis]|uniref:uncharacterized protein LOC124364144 n=1 Tax=Homalodisca vitripennis TaxID=197043 RepID=UPI001EECEC5A|nr:uncharacterized protein LOC124364144 [Homalodisca vitripennis]XP_046675341.1 uncharacterized protein LOC124364144 [Homalodisca vitripennis]XP_046675342.1 uncharacterized protein LOC124364144 [Homalodisca vitripennis]XP_046675343.1 uncharacterized protein LOC124364144 [Homalodisca vitripennis]
MEDNCNVFYGTICNVCKSLPNHPEAMKFCSGCKLVQYCGNHHQKTEWCGHKSFCKSIQHIMKRTGTDHVFKDASEFAEKDSVQWNNLRMSVINLVQLILKRPLTTVENQILLFPPVCSFCRVYKPNKMFSCESCHSVLFCSREHQSSDSKHSGACKSLAMAFEINITRFFKQFVLFDCMKNFTPPNELPHSIELFLKQGNSLSIENVMYSQPLSYALTLAYAISKIGKVSRNKMTVHVVGADAMEAQALYTFPVIFNLLKLAHLTIVMIGPNLPDDTILPSGLEQKCSLILISKKLYHEYVSSDAFIRPDVTVVYNCGFCEFSDVPEKDIWKNTLPFILNQRDCLVILTSYTAEESRQDLTRLGNVSDHVASYNVLVANEENPFCSLCPLRNWEAGFEAVFYVNKYISVLQT